MNTEEEVLYSEIVKLWEENTRLHEKMQKAEIEFNETKEIFERNCKLRDELLKSRELFVRNFKLIQK